MKKINHLLFFCIFYCAYLPAQTTINLAAQCDCEVIDGTTDPTNSPVNPTGADIGNLYVNTVSGKLFVWDGSAWKSSPAFSEPWFGTDDNAAATENTVVMYHSGRIHVGEGITSPDAYVNFPTAAPAQILISGQTELDDTKLSEANFHNGTVGGLRVTSTTDNAAASIFGANNHVFTAAGSTAALSNMRATASHAQADGDNDMNFMYGSSIASFNNGGGTIMDVVGTNALFGNNQNGTVSNLAGVKVNGYLGAASTTENYYSFWARVVSTPAGFTINDAAYGLYIDDMPEPIDAHKDFGVYQMGTDDYNYFGGHTAIGSGTVNPDSSLAFPQFDVYSVSSVNEIIPTSAYGNHDLFFGMGSTLVANPTSAVGGYYGADINMNVPTENAVMGIPSLSATVANVHYDGSGSASTVRGVGANIVNRGSGTITNAYGLRPNIINSGTGTITNGYGIQILDVQADNGYGVYQVSSDDKNVFAGTVSLIDATETNTYYGNTALGATSSVGMHKMLDQDAEYGTTYTLGGQFTLSHKKPSNSTSYSYTVSGDNLTDASSTVDYLVLAGGSFIGTHQGSGNISNLQGANIGANNTGSGSVTNLYGSSAAVQHTGSGTVTNMYGNRSAIRSTGTATNSYGYFSQALGGGGSVTNAYGIYLEDADGMNDFGVYQAGENDDNYLAGSTGIGTDTPAELLDIHGTAETNWDADLDVSSYGTNITSFHVNSAGGTKDAPTAISGKANANILNIEADGYDGSAFRTAASIRFSTDGNANTGTGDMPGRLSFLTTADGAAAPTERMVINSAGNTGIGEATPDAKLHVVKAASDLTPAIIEGCQEYADNAAAIAAGLPIGGLYRLADGTLKVVY